MKDQIMKLIDMCHSQKGTSTMFMWDVRTARKLSLVLANERQLDYIERFGTRSLFTVSGVDPTFNICDYNVAITTSCQKQRHSSGYARYNTDTHKHVVWVSLYIT